LDLCPRCAISFALFEDALPVATPDDPSPPGAKGAIFGDYELIEEIARGGMGVVYRARQRSLDRIVALKMILAGQFATKEFIRRFRVEAGSAAALQHPNIVAIHEVGVHGGHHFFSMDCVQGQNLAELVGNRPLPLKQAARYLKQIAEAVHYAHQQGVLHRDLKPQNILIDSATDQPRITDFGLARKLEGDSSVTITGQVLGSPHFMPPEQAGGRRGTVGRHSDVYSLGGILFFLLTARPPFQGDSIEETLHNVLNTEAISPRLLNPSAPRDLETICLKCLEREPSRRYQTADELAQELDRFLKHEPIHARPVPRFEHAWRWCRRNPSLASALSLILILVLVILIASPIAIIRINRARQTAELNLYAADMNLANQAVEANRIQQARALLDKHIPAKKGSLFAATDLRGWEWRYLKGQCRSDELATLLTGLPQISTVLFSPDGKLLFAAADDGIVHVWEFPSRRKLECFQTYSGKFVLDAINRHHAIAISPDGRILAAGGPSKDILLWEIGSHQKLATLTGHTDWVSNVDFAPDGKTLASASFDGTMRLWDMRINSFPQISVIRHGRGGFLAMFTPDGRTLATTGRDRYVRFWDVSNLSLPVCLPDPIEEAGWTWAMAFSPDGKFLAAGENSATRFWDLATRTVAETLSGQATMANAVAFSPDGRKFASGGEDTNISLWDVAQPSHQLTLRGHSKDVYSVAFSRDGNVLVSGARDGTVKLWDVSTIEPREQIWSFQDFLGQVAFSPDSRYLAGVSEGPTEQLKLWDVASKRELRAMDLEPVNSPSLSFSEDGKILAVYRGRAEGQSLLVEIPSFREIAKISSDTLALSPKGNFAVLARGRNVIRRDIQSGAEIILGEIPPGDACKSTISPDGRKAAIEINSSALPPLITVWGTSRAEEPLVLRGHLPLYRVVRMAFSPDSKLLASAGWDGLLGLWHAETGKKIALFPAHVGEAWGVAFSPDGRTLASSGDDNMIKFWNLATRQEAAALHGHKGAISAIAFSPDGKHFASGADRMVKIWDAPTFEEIEQAQKIESSQSK
jgi:WD40 repeat protein/serine/threonine protein kinase